MKPMKSIWSEYILDFEEAEQLEKYLDNNRFSVRPLDDKNKSILDLDGTTPHDAGTLTMKRNWREEEYIKLIIYNNPRLHEAYLEYSGWVRGSLSSSAPCPESEQLTK